MKRLRLSLRKDGRGAAIIEFGLLAPVLVMALIGTAQLGIMFFANAGLRNAVGEGARYATIFPRPTNAQIIAKMETERFGLKSADVIAPTIVSGTADGVSYLDISMGYTLRPDFVFYEPAPITIRETRRVYVQPTS